MDWFTVTPYKETAFEKWLSDKAFPAMVFAFTFGWPSLILGTATW